MDTPAMPAALATEPINDINHQLGADTILAIIRDALNGWNWSKKTDSDLIEHISKIALKYNTTFETMQEISEELAKAEYMNMKDSKYEFMQIGSPKYLEFGNYELKKRSNPELMHTYSKASFIIWIDTKDNIWVVYRSKPCHVGSSPFQKIETLFSSIAMKLISCLGKVYFHYDIDLDVEIRNLPDNIIHISYRHEPLFTNLPKYLLGFDYPIKNNSSFLLSHPLKYLIVCANQIKNIPLGSENILVKRNDYYNPDHNLNTNTEDNYVMMPYGVKNLLISGIFADNFYNLPPTIEECSIDCIYTQINNLPISLRKLNINSILDSKLSNITDIEKLEIKPELLITTTICSEDGLKSFKRGCYTFNNIIFPDGFEELKINKCNIEDIIPAILEVPKSFTKLIINNKYITGHIKKFYVKYINKSYKKPESDVNSDTEENDYNKSILDAFIERFPHIIIENIN